MNENDRSIVSIASVSHALVHTYELTIPIFMVIWLSEFGTTEAVLGLIVAIGYGLFGIGALPSGIVVDKVGSQRLIAACLAGMGVSFVVLSLATNLLAVAGAVILWGAAASIYHPAGLSLISTGVEDSNNGFAYHGMAGNAGIALGPLISVILLLVADWRLVATLLAIPAFVAIALILRADIDERAAVETPDDVADDDGSRGDPDVSSIRELFTVSKTLFVGGFSLVFLILVFNRLYYRGILTFLPDLLSGFVGDDLVSLGTVEQHFNPSDFVYIAILMVGIGGQFAGGRALDRIRVEKGLTVGYLALIAIALLFSIVAETGIVFLVAVSLLLGFVLFSLQPMYQFAVAEYTSADTRGLAYGYTYVAQFGIGALGAAVVGLVLTHATVGVMFLTLGAFAFLAAVVSAALFWRSERGLEKPV